MTTPCAPGRQRHKWNRASCEYDACPLCGGVRRVTRCTRRRRTASLGLMVESLITGFLEAKGTKQ